uniref:GPI transamidase component PIG-T n=1 Tax=Parascaris univalens TaxID=6257 RepID=A0A915AS64_PARUN
MNRLAVFLLLLPAIPICGRRIVSLKGNDTYTEELFLKRLRGEQMLSQFRFVAVSDNPLTSDYGTFPRIIGEVINKYDVREFHLSLTQGFWRTAEWGIAPQPATPSGAQLYAWFDGNAESVDERWIYLVNSLNGIFCTSLLQMVPSLSSSPQFSFLPRGLAISTDHRFMRYGALSGENVCTENLTPWRKLLPCKETGLSMLLNPIKLYSSMFHSMSVHVIRVCKNGTPPCEERVRVELNLNMVSDVNLRYRTLDWSFIELFARKVDSKCVVADSSVIIFERDRKSLSIDGPSKHYEHDGRVFFVYDIGTMPSSSFPINLIAKYKSRLNLSIIRPQSLLSLQSYLGGSGQQSGRVISVIENRQSSGRRAVYTHIIPWFMRVYFHTMKYECSDHRGISQPGIVHRRNFVPAKDRQRPFLIEWDITVAANSFCEFSFDFDKAFLRVSEFPPDANHGSYVPAAVLTFIADDELWNRNRSAFGGYRTTALEELLGEVPSRTLTIFGEALLVLLPVPDFSMPFNVICLVCTAMAMLFGPVHSLTTRIMIPLSSRDKDLAPQPPIWRLISFMRSKTSALLQKLRSSSINREENVDESEEKVTSHHLNENEEDVIGADTSGSKSLTDGTESRSSSGKESEVGGKCCGGELRARRAAVHRAKRVE